MLLFYSEPLREHRFKPTTLLNAKSSSVLQICVSHQRALDFIKTILAKNQIKMQGKLCVLQNYFTKCLILYKKIKKRTLWPFFRPLVCPINWEYFVQMMHSTSQRQCPFSRHSGSKKINGELFKAIKGSVKTPDRKVGVEAALTNNLLSKKRILCCEKLKLRLHRAGFFFSFLCDGVTSKQNAVQ